MSKFFLQAGALSAALAVVLGAFGAHALKARFTEYALGIFETGVKYQFYHAFGLMVVGLLFYKTPLNVQAIWSGRLFIAGTALFSLSLYLLAWAKSAGESRFNFLGAITPLGGLCFIAAWALMAWAVGKAG